MQDNRIKIVINGIKDTTHSVALVNQFQLIYLSEHRNSFLMKFNSLKHNWPKINPGFHSDDREIINSYEKPKEEDTYDISYSIGSSENLIKATRNFHFFVTEFGLANNDGLGFKKTLENGDTFIIPSTWVKNRITDKIGDHKNIKLVPHGYSSKYFHKIDNENRNKIRESLGINENTHVFLNVGALTWNKGVDLLLIAFSKVLEKNKNIKLLIKDSSNLYNNKIEDLASELINKKYINSSALDAIIKITGHQSLDNMNLIYNISDTYVSPYRAEGFNLPVIEAMATGSNVIVTNHGPTDDYVSKEKNKIESRIIASNIGTYLEPSTEHLIDQMQRRTDEELKRVNYEDLENFEYKNIAKIAINTFTS